MNSFDIFTSSFHFFYKYCVGTRKENLYFDAGDLKDKKQNGLILKIANFPW